MSEGGRSARLRRITWVGVLVLVGLISLSVVGLRSASSQSSSGPPAKVRICHATSSHSNPYVSEEPAIGNNGDISGGHLNHTGPVFPASDWGDIIPPYVYTDDAGADQTFPGYNWSPDGQAIWQNGCNPGASPLVPIVECVERTPGGGFLAHFGYNNPNSTVVVSPLENRFEPDSANGAQPLSFDPGRVTDAFQVPSTGGDLTWFLTGNRATATADSPACQGSITIVKVLNPSLDPGRFNLEIGGETAGGASGVGDGGTTGSVAVTTGSHTVGESAAAGTDLGRYATQIVCVSGETTVAQAAATSVAVRVGRGQAVECTITNTRKLAQPVTPILECVVFAAGKPDVAVWGYDNRNPFSVDIPVGSANGFAPSPVDRGQPTDFDPGRWVGVLQTPFAGAATLAWTLGGTTATADASSSACTPTVELRKVTVPADDPGVFNLLINANVVATGGNGTTSGVVTVGVGEGTVSETAGAGTNLADYDSKIDCTRNGSPALSVTGTKADGAVANGDVVVCTFTNQRKPGPPSPPQPPIPPIPPPAPLVDLVVTKTAAPASVVVGRKITWTVRVTNASKVDAADVNLVKVSERSYRSRLLSVEPSQGTCSTTSCSLGRLAAGATATITVVSRATRVGTILNVVRVGSEEQESDYLNNTASAVVRVTAPVSEAVKAAANVVSCHTLVAVPSSLRKGATSIVLTRARTRFGSPVRRLLVRIRGLGVDYQARTNALGIARFVITPPRSGVVTVERTRLLSNAAGPRCRTLLGVLGAVHPEVTG